MELGRAAQRLAGTHIPGGFSWRDARRARRGCAAVARYASTRGAARLRRWRSHRCDAGARTDQVPAGAACSCSTVRSSRVRSAGRSRRTRGSGDHVNIQILAGSTARRHRCLRVVGARHAERPRPHRGAPAPDAAPRSGADTACRKRRRRPDPERGRILQHFGSPPTIPTACSDHRPVTSQRCSSARSARR